MMVKVNGVYYYSTLPGELLDWRPMQPPPGKSADHPQVVAYLAYHARRKAREEARPISRLRRFLKRMFSR